MNSKHAKYTHFKKLVASVIPTGKENAATTSELMDILGCSRRQLKQTILELRNDYPICSKDVDGGGYWMADCDSDIVEFNNVLKSRVRTTNETIAKMTQHIGGPY